MTAFERATDPSKIGRPVGFARVPGRAASFLGLVPIPLVYLGVDHGSPIWMVMGEVKYTEGDQTFIVRNGYTFDLASVPRFLWGIIAPFELSTLAPLLHDLLYGFKGFPPSGYCIPRRVFTRAEVDGLFLRVMEAEGVSRWKRLAAWMAVRCLGWTYWNRHPDPQGEM